MKISVELNEAEVGKAIDSWLRAERGMKTDGKVTVNHFNGDQRDPSYTTFSVSAEPTGRTER